MELVELNGMREISVHRIKNGQLYDYPEWYYDSIKLARKKKICRYCGKPLPKGERTYCSFECKRHWQCWAGINSLRTNGVRREIHKKFGFACTKCGEIFSQKFESGVEVPRFYGEVHHVIPLHKGGEDEFNNLTLLCPKCHKEEHYK